MSATIAVILEIRPAEGRTKERREVFADYRLRVASVIRDYGMQERAEAPKDSRAQHG